MEDRVENIIKEYCDGELKQMVLSKSRPPKEWKKIVIRPILLKEGLCFQAEKYQGAKVYHENLAAGALMGRIQEWLENGMRQVNIQSLRAEATILISKKGKAAVSVRKARQKADASLRLEHNRAKHYIIEEGKAVPFLVDLGVMTQEGRIVHSKYDKFRQINRFLEFIEDILPEFEADEEIAILDFGCGKSYLTFAMYYYLHELKGRRIRVTGLDLKDDVIERCGALAVRYGYDGLHFVKGDIASYQDCARVDMVVTLHACDTATDDALKKAVDWNARVILSVPCCQHELNRTLENEMLAPVLKYGLLKERLAALITDGLRADLLEQMGYKVQVLEFIDMEHTPKNVLLRAVKRKGNLAPVSLRREKRNQYKRCIQELHVNPALYRQMYKEE